MIIPSYSRPKKVNIRYFFIRIPRKRFISRSLIPETTSFIDQSKQLSIELPILTSHQSKYTLRHFNPWFPLQNISSCHRSIFEGALSSYVSIFYGQSLRTVYHPKLTEKCSPKEHSITFSSYNYRLFKYAIDCSIKIVRLLCGSSKT